MGAIYLIALPIYYANVAPEAVPTTIDPVSSIEETFEDSPQIKPMSERIDLNRITWGVGSLLSYAAVAVYLNSPGLRRHFKH